jgi:hypothetical protein
LLGQLPKAADVTTPPSGGPLALLWVLVLVQALVHRCLPAAGIMFVLGVHVRVGVDNAPGMLVLMRMLEVLVRMLVRHVAGMRMFVGVLRSVLLHAVSSVFVSCRLAERSR